MKILKVDVLISRVGLEHRTQRSCHSGGMLSSGSRIITVLCVTVGISSAKFPSVFSELTNMDSCIQTSGQGFVV